MEVPSVGDQYNLKWNNHLANFVQNFIEHQNSEFLVDVTLSCEGQYIKAHKLILSSCSDYFHSIFQVHGTVPHPIILLNGVEFNDLKYILHFMYHGEVKVVDKDLPNVLALGESLQIKGLSSVKIRDTSSSEKPLKSPKILQRNSMKKDVKAKRNDNSNGASPLKTLPTTALVKPVNENNVRFDYSRRKSPKEPIPINTLPETPQQCVFPVISSVTSVAVPMDSLTKGENLPKNNAASKDPLSNATTSAQNEGTNLVPKPPHAFMIFATEWRKKLKVEHPEENNKEISVRLGTMWKNLLPETKNIYYREAKRAEEEHKSKYPKYVSLTLKRKSDILNETVSSNLVATNVDPMEIVETQEDIFICDSD